MQRFKLLEHFLILISVVSGYVSTSAFASYDGFSVSITSSAPGLEICTLTAGIKKHKSIIKTRRKKHDKKVLLEKNKLTAIEVLISKALIN